MTVQYPPPLILSSSLRIESKVLIKVFVSLLGDINYQFINYRQDSLHVWRRRGDRPSHITTVII